MRRKRKKVSVNCAADKGRVLSCVMCELFNKPSLCNMQMLEAIRMGSTKSYPSCIIKNKIYPSCLIHLSNCTKSTEPKF